MRLHFFKDDTAVEGLASATHDTLAGVDVPNRAGAKEPRAQRIEVVIAVDERCRQLETRVDETRRVEEAIGLVVARLARAADL